MTAHQLDHVEAALEEAGVRSRAPRKPEAAVFADLSGYQVYACGAPAMTDIARKTFVETRGLPEDEFYCDAFTPSVDPRK